MSCVQIDLFCFNSSMQIQVYTYSNFDTISYSRNRREERNKMNHLIFVLLCFLLFHTINKLKIDKYTRVDQSDWQAISQSIFHSQKISILIIDTMNYLFRGNNIYVLEIIWKLRNKTKHANFLNPPFFGMPCSSKMSVFKNICGYILASEHQIFKILISSWGTAIANFLLYIIYFFIFFGGGTPFIMPVIC